MGIAGNVVVFVVIWWLVFFMTLSFGVRGQWEDGHVEDGTEPGAPQSAGIRKKMLVTTGIAMALWAMVWLAVRFELVRFGDGTSWGT